MSFKVVYIKKKNEVEPVPHLWESGGKLYWPPSQKIVRQQQSYADSVPDKETWGIFDCVVKAERILLFVHASKTADGICKATSSSSGTSTEDEVDKPMYKKQENQRTGQQVTAEKPIPRHIRLKPTTKKCSNAFQYDFDTPHTGPLTIDSQTKMSQKKIMASLSTPQIMPEPNLMLQPDENEFDQTITGSYKNGKYEILEEEIKKLNMLVQECKELATDLKVTMEIRFDRLDALLKKNTDLTLPGEEPITQMFPIGNVDDLQKFENDLDDATNKKKIFNHLHRTIGTGIFWKVACYKLCNTMFTKELLTKYSWTGMSRTNDKKAFNRLVKMLDLFYKIIFKADNTFNYAQRDSFFRDAILKHSKTRLHVSKKKVSKVSTKATQNVNDINENETLSTSSNEKEEEMSSFDNVSSEHESEPDVVVVQELNDDDDPPLM